MADTASRVPNPTYPSLLALKPDYSSLLALNPGLKERMDANSGEDIGAQSLVQNFPLKVAQTVQQYQDANAPQPKTITKSDEQHTTGTTTASQNTSGSQNNDETKRKLYDPKDAIELLKYMNIIKSGSPEYKEKLDTAQQTKSVYDALLHSSKPELDLSGLAALADVNTNNKYGMRAGYHPPAQDNLQRLAALHKEMRLSQEEPAKYLSDMARMAAGTQSYGNKSNNTDVNKTGTSDVNKSGTVSTVSTGDADKAYQFFTKEHEPFLRKDLKQSFMDANELTRIAGSSGFNNAVEKGLATFKIIRSAIGTGRINAQELAVASHADQTLQNLFEGWGNRNFDNRPVTKEEAVALAQAAYNLASPVAESAETQLRSMAHERASKTGEPEDYLVDHYHNLAGTTREKIGTLLEKMPDQMKNINSAFNSFYPENAQAQKEHDAIVNGAPPNRPKVISDIFKRVGVEK